MDSTKGISNVMPTDNEEFKRATENYERSVEHRSTNTAQTQTNPQSGILKNKRKDQSKPSSTRNLVFGDIVVIDNKDINESTQHEGDVIVVDKDVDLAELLGSDWPKTTGDAAEILNRQKLQISTRQSASAATTTGISVSSSGAGISGSTNTGTQPKRTNRNKSSNPLLHLGSGVGSTKSIKTVEKKLQSWK